MTCLASESAVFPLHCMLIELCSRQKKTSLIIAVIKKLYRIIWQVMTLVYVQGKWIDTFVLF